MKLSAYLTEYGSKSKLAKKINVHTQTMWHWATGYRPVPVQRCLAIESATDGAVTRCDLRPNDWREIWPDFVCPDVVQAHANTAQPATQVVAQGA